MSPILCVTVLFIILFVRHVYLFNPNQRVVLRPVLNGEALGTSRVHPKKDTKNGGQVDSRRLGTRGLPWTRLGVSRILASHALTVLR